MPVSWGALSGGLRTPCCTKHWGYHEVTCRECQLGLPEPGIACLQKSWGRVQVSMHAGHQLRLWLLFRASLLE